MLDFPEEIVPNSAVIGASRIMSMLFQALKLLRLREVSIDLPPKS